MYFRVAPWRRVVQVRKPLPRRCGAKGSHTLGYFKIAIGLFASFTAALQHEATSKQFLCYSLRMKTDGTDTTRTCREIERRLFLSQPHHPLRYERFVPSSGTGNTILREFDTDDGHP